MDEVHIEKVLNGDINAFAYFVREYKLLAYSISVSILKNEDEANDAVQDAFIQAFRKLHSFKGNSKFSTWFSRIVVNTAMKQVKRKSQYEQLPVDESTISGLPDALSRLNEDDQRSCIDRAMKSIPENEALALNLYYLEEYNVKEIMAITGWSGSNVKVILFRARKQMYGQLSKILSKETKYLY